MNRYEVGRKYEQEAVDYLRKNGYEILDRNYREKCGELDAVGKKDGKIVIFEVKFRSSSFCGDPLSAVDGRKQRRICRTSLHYLIKHGYNSDMPCRFDVIAIYADGAIRHIENAFDFCM